MVENLEARELLSTSWFVSPGGSNSNSGSINAPFKTIQQAANVAGAGDHVEIETGTYHESVTVNRSGITFESYKGEKVTVTGADSIGGWTQYSGNIYSAPMGWTLGEGSNEIFVNGVGLNEAEFPNSAVGNASNPGTLTMSKVSGNTIYSSSLNQPANYWKGAIIHMEPGQGWVDETGVVTSSSPGSITISAVNMGASTHAVAGNKFNLFGTFKALDSAGEWYKDPSSGRVYLWAPNGGNPNSMDVEAKHRQLAFNLSNASGTTIKGINVFAGGITTSTKSSKTVINGVTADYVAHNTLVPNGWYTAPAGIVIRGSGSVVENSTIAYSTNDGIVVSGASSTVSNNVIHDVDTVGADVAAVRVMASYITVSHNTIYNSGRHGVIAEVSHATITYNTIHDVGLQTTEAGGIYTAKTTTNKADGQGSVMAYNQIYNIHTGGFGGTALFLDNNTSGWIIHNNTTWNVDFGLKMNYTCRNDSVYNNTLSATRISIDANQAGSWPGVSVYNNVIPNGIVSEPGGKIYNNSTSASNTKGLGSGAFSSGASGVVAVTPVLTGGSGSGTSTSTTTATTTSTSSSSSTATSTKPTTTTSIPPTTTTTPTPSTTTPSAKAKLMAVNYTAASKTAGDGFGGVGHTSTGSYVAYKLDFGTGVTKLTAAVAAKYAGGSIEIHVGSPTGTLVGTLKVAVTKGWSNYTSQIASVTGLKGVETVYLVFKGPRGGVANLDSIQFS
jgi:hypothetical protein